MPYNALLGPDQCYGMDDGGFCEVCGEHVDSGRCEGHCENETCQHEAHCDNCGEGMDYIPASGVCFVCAAAWLASHQLMDREPVYVVGFDPAAPNGDAAVAVLFKRDGNTGQITLVASAVRPKERSAA